MSASPTSHGSGSRSIREPLPRITTSPVRQSKSSSLKRGDLAAAQPEPRQQRQDREVSTPERRRAIAALKQAASPRPAASPRGRRLAPRRDRRHRLDERHRDQPLHVQKPQQRPERAHHRLRRPLPDPPRLAQHERVDLLTPRGTPDHRRAALTAPPGTGARPAHTNGRCPSPSPARPASSDKTAQAADPHPSVQHPQRQKGRRARPNSPSNGRSALDDNLLTRPTRRRSTRNRSTAPCVSPDTSSPSASIHRLT